MLQFFNLDILEVRYDNSSCFSPVYYPFFPQIGTIYAILLCLFRNAPCIASSTSLLDTGLANFLVGASDGCFAVVEVLVLLLHLFSCCSKAVLNNSSNSFSVNSGRVGLEMQLVVGARSSEINWSSLSSRKPCSSSISCVERFDITVRGQ